MTDLKVRTKQFALRLVRLYRTLPATEEARIFGKQLLRAGTSVGANYRAACRSRSRAEFLAKTGHSFKGQMSASSGSNYYWRQESAVAKTFSHLQRKRMNLH